MTSLSVVSAEEQSDKGSSSEDESVDKISISSILDLLLCQGFNFINFDFLIFSHLVIIFFLTPPQVVNIVSSSCDGSDSE